MLTTLLQSGLDSAVEAVETVAQPQEMTMSLFELFMKGGALMWVLLALSIVAIYIFGKKWWVLRKAGTVDQYFMKDINDLLLEGKTKSAVALCQKYDTPVARMVEKGIDRMGRPLQDIQTAQYDRKQGKGHILRHRRDSRQLQDARDIQGDD